MKIKVCILTTVHPLTDTRIFHKQAKSLARAGYDVTLVARHARDEIVDGIRVAALPNPANRIMRMTKTAWHAYKLALKNNADIYHFHDPELIPIGLLLKLHGKRVIYDVHEDVPKQTLSKDYLPWIIRKPLAWIISAAEWLGSQVFVAIVTATPKIAERFPVGKTVTIQNFPVVAELLNPSSLSYIERPQSFAYIGSIANIRGAIEMIKALEYFDKHLDVSLELAGEFSPASLENEIRKFSNWASVHYYGPVSRHQVKNILSGVRAGLVTLHPIVNYLDSYPVKLFEYMSAGLPVIASDFPLWRRIIDGAGCGLLVDPMNPKEIAEAMTWVLDHPTEAEAMGMRGRQAVERTYNWAAEEVKLLKLYKDILNP